MECLLWLILYAIGALIFLWVFEALLAQLYPPPPPILALIRLAVALIVLLKGWHCLAFLIDSSP